MGYVYPATTTGIRKGKYKGQVLTFSILVKIIVLSKFITSPRIWSTCFCWVVRLFALSWWNGLEQLTGARRRSHNSCVVSMGGL
jgi:hypothetical protein